MKHSHSDRLIKTCKICQDSIKSINEAYKELSEIGIWSKLPKKLKKGQEYILWENKVK